MNICTMKTLKFNPLWAIAYPTTREISISAWFCCETSTMDFPQSCIIELGGNQSQLFVDPHFYDFLSTPVKAELDRVIINESGMQVAYYKYRENE